MEKMLRIYVGTFGNPLLGNWVDDPSENPDTLREELENAIYAGFGHPNPTDEYKEKYPLPEYGIMDSSGFGTYRIDESIPLDTLCTLIQGVNKYGSVFAAYFDYENIEPNEDDFLRAYIGTYESLDAYVQERIDEEIEVAYAMLDTHDRGRVDNRLKHLHQYIDRVRYGNDLEINQIWTLRLNHKETAVFNRL